MKNITNAEEMPLPKLGLCSLPKFFYYFLMNVVGLYIRKYCGLGKIRSGDFDAFTCFHPLSMKNKIVWGMSAVYLYVCKYVYMYEWMDVRLASA
jgi:hypothetical protein